MADAAVGRAHLPIEPADLVRHLSRVVDPPPHAGGGVLASSRAHDDRLQAGRRARRRSPGRARGGVAGSWRRGDPRAHGGPRPLRSALARGQPSTPCGSSARRSRPPSGGGRRPRGRRTGWRARARRSQEELSMRSRPLGRLEVPALGYGAMVLSPGMYGPTDDDAGIAALHHLIDAGGGFIDTSDAYGRDSHNELLVGRALHGRREARGGGDEVRVPLSSGRDTPCGPDHILSPRGAGERRAALRAAVRARQPGQTRDRAHRSLVPALSRPSSADRGHGRRDGRRRGRGLGRTHRALERDRRAAPASMLRAHRGGRAGGVVAVDADHRGASRRRPRARRRDRGVVAARRRVPHRIGHRHRRGRLPHQLRSLLARAPCQQQRAVRPLRAVAAQLGITPGQLALAWLLHQHPAVVPIPGSRRPAHIDENLAAAAIELSAADLSAVDDALAAFVPAGRALM